MATHPAPLSGRLSGLAVLVVEDEMLLAMDYEAILRREGCRVIGPVPRVRPALDLIGRDSPDVAVLDLNLQGELSTPVAEALAARAIPFVVVSGYRSAAPRAPVFENVARLDKPVAPDLLVETIARLARRGAAPESGGPEAGGPGSGGPGLGGRACG